MERLRRRLGSFTRKPSADLLVATTLFALTATIGGAYCLYWRTPTYYPETLQSGVVWACGRGYVNPSAQAAPRLRDFVNYAAGTDISSFSCAELPADLDPQPLEPTQRLTPYIIMTIGAFWRIAGMSWDRLWIMTGFFYGLTNALVYAILRFGMGRLLAAALTLILASSSLQLAILPHIRDYDKAPFFLALVLILATLVRRQCSTAKLLLLSGGYGVLLGVALGFRPDFLVFTPPLFVTVLLFMPGSSLLMLKRNLIALSLAVFAFLIVGRPVLFSNTQDASGWIVVIHGLASPFDRSLGVDNNIYTVSYKYPSDLWAQTQYHSYSYRATGSHELSTDRVGSPAPARQYFVDVAKNFPADMLIRAYAAILRVTDLPYDQGPEVYVDRSDLSPVAKQVATGPLLGAALAIVTAIRLAMQACFAGAGPWLVATTILVVLVRSWRLGLFLACVVLYFGGYTMLQFQARHAFHLEFIGLWALGFLVYQGWRALAPVWRRMRRLDRPQFGGIVRSGSDRAHVWECVLALYRTRTSRRLGISLVLATVAILVPLYVARLYQQSHLTTLFAAYEQMAMVPLNTTIEHASDLQAMARVVPIDLPIGDAAVEFATPPVDRAVISTQYIVAEVGGEQCHWGQVQFGVRYEGHRDEVPSAFDFSRDMLIPVTGAAPTRVYFPIYNADYLGLSTRFQGIVVREEQLPCLGRLDRVEDLSRLRLLPSLVLHSGWRGMPLYQRLTRNPVEELMWAHSAKRAEKALLTMDGWVLKSYAMDDAAFMRGEAVDVRLDWEIPALVEPRAAPTFFQDHDREWVQVLPAVRNLVVNGAFEGPEPFAGFPNDIYSGDRTTRSVVSASWAGQNKLAAVLSNGVAHRRSSLVTGDIPVSEGVYYVQIAAVRSEGGNILVGRQWLPSGVYSYAVGGSDAANWTPVVEVVTPPGNRGDTAVDIWLLNYESEGKAYFADIGLMALGARNLAPCAIEPATGRMLCAPPLLPAR